MKIFISLALVSWFVSLVAGICAQNEENFSYREREKLEVICGGTLLFGAVCFLAAIIIAIWVFLP